MKQIGMVVLLAAIFSIGIATVAFAENTSDHPDETKKLSPKSFGSKTGKVCGDKLCVNETLGISDSISVVLSSQT